MNEIFLRRSIRTYSEKDVEHDKLLRIVQAGFEAPSAHWRRPWEFMIVTDNDKIQRISEMDDDPQWGGRWCGNAKAIIVVLLNKNKKMTPELDPDDAYWIQDLSAATENILLQATSEGLGSCWMGWYPSETRVKNFSNFFNLPENILPFSIVALGYPRNDFRMISHYKPENLYLNSYGECFETIQKNDEF